MSTSQTKLDQLESQAQKLDKKLDHEAAQLKKPKAASQVQYPFWFGGSAASMAAVCTHPLDLSMFTTVMMVCLSPTDTVHSQGSTTDATA
jgi:hypothetical protein